MRVTLVLIALILLGAAFSGAGAQETAPIEPVATLAAGNFRAMGVTADGSRLLIADAETEQVRVYDLRDPTNPQRVEEVNLYGVPVDLATGSGFTLVAVEAEGGTDLIEVIAPSNYNPRAIYSSSAFIDVSDGIRSVHLSPNRQWAVAIGARGYTLLNIISASNINSASFEFPALADAVVTNDRVLLASSSNPVIQPAALEVNQPERAESLTLDAPARQLALNLRGTLAAALLDNNTLALFDPDALQTIATLPLEGRTVSEIAFLTLEGAEWLLLAGTNEAGGTEIAFLDVSDPTDAGIIGTLPLTASVEAMTTYDDLIIITDGQTVSVYNAQD